MNERSVPVTIRVLDKEYRVSCAYEEREALMEAARILNGKMREVRDSGKVLGLERIAVMTALNIIHECLQHQQVQEAQEQTMHNGVRRLVDKIDAVLGRRNSKDTVD